MAGLQNSGLSKQMLDESEYRSRLDEHIGATFTIVIKDKTLIQSQYGRTTGHYFRPCSPSTMAFEVVRAQEVAGELSFVKTSFDRSC